MAGHCGGEADHAAKLSILRSNYILILNQFNEIENLFGLLIFVLAGYIIFRDLAFTRNISKTG